MRCNPVSTILLCVVSLFPAATCHARTTAQLHTTSQGFLTVRVSLNGAGPYSFLLDTGSNRTLVQTELLEKLGVPSGKTILAHVATGVSTMHPAVVSSVAVGSLAVHDLEIEGIDAAQLTRLGESFQGVLGEDFLKHFDVLIDNREKTLTLDETSELAYSLTGDRLPLSFAGTRDGHTTSDRLVFDLKLPVLAATTRFLIDSGANHPMFFPAKPIPLPNRSTPGGTLKTFNGSSRCQNSATTLAIGKSVIPDVDLASCDGMRANTDVDGILPTSTFKRLFISHTGAYAIANPRITKSLANLLTTNSSGD